MKAGIVAEAEHYVYSSALDYAGGKGLYTDKVYGIVLFIAEGTEVTSAP